LGAVKWVLAGDYGQKTIFARKEADSKLKEMFQFIRNTATLFLHLDEFDKMFISLTKTRSTLLCSNKTVKHV